MDHGGSKIQEGTIGLTGKHSSVIRTFYQLSNRILLQFNQQRREVSLSLEKVTLRLKNGSQVLVKSVYDS